MKISQLTKLMPKDDEIIIDDENLPIGRMNIYAGTVRGITRDDPINKMHINDGRCKERVAKDALNLINRQKAVIEELGKGTNIKKVILPFINEKGKMVERTFNVDINCLEEGDHDD